MSSDSIVNLVVSQTVEVVKPPRVKKPTLPAKLQKLAVFQFWLLNSLKDASILSEESFESALTALHVCDSLELQTSHLNSSLDAYSLTNKTLRKFITTRNAPPKPPKKERAPRVPKDPNAPKKERAPRAPKDPNAPKKERAPRAPKDPNAPKKERAPRAPKDPNAPKKVRAKKNVIVSNDTQDNLVAQIVAAASSPLLETSVDPVLETPTVVLETVDPLLKTPIVVETPTVVETKVKKPRAKKTSDPKPTKTPKQTKKSNMNISAIEPTPSIPPSIPPSNPPSNSNPDPDPDADSEDIQTREIYIDSVLYLLDDSDGSLYSPDSNLGNPLLGKLVNDSFVPL